MAKRNVLLSLICPGTFVLTPSGKFGVVRRFNRSTNEVLVQFGATGLADPSDDWLREKGLADYFHFEKLRLAPTNLEPASLPQRDTKLEDITA